MYSGPSPLSFHVCCFSRDFDTVNLIDYLDGGTESEEVGVADVHRVRRAGRDAVDDVDDLLAGHVDPDRHHLTRTDLLVFLVVDGYQRVVLIVDRVEAPANFEQVADAGRVDRGAD